MASCCSSGARLLYACSGAADVGALSDRVARQLSREGFGGMSCLAALGAGLSGFVESAKAAENIVIDGCSVACGRRVLERIGVPLNAFVLTDMGLVKGKAPVTEAAVEEMAAKIKRTDAGAPPNTHVACAGNCDCGEKGEGCR